MEEYGAPYEKWSKQSYFDVPLYCETATKKLTFSTTSVLRETF